MGPKGSLPHVPILSHSNPVCAAPFHFLNIHFNTVCLFPAGLTTKTLQAPLPYPTRATRPAYLVPFDLITRVTFGGIRSSIT
jgi:hypothetical protein